MYKGDKRCRPYHFVYYCINTIAQNYCSWNAYHI